MTFSIVNKYFHLFSSIVVSRCIYQTFFVTAGTKNKPHFPHQVIHQVKSVFLCQQWFAYIVGVYPLSDIMSNNRKMQPLGYGL